MNCAIISLPLPLSPVMKTDASVGATFRASSIARRKAGAVLAQFKRVLAPAADCDVVPFVPEYSGAAFAQRVLVVHHKNPHAGLGFRPDRQQRGRLPHVAGLDTVL